MTDASTPDTEQEHGRVRGSIDAARGAAHDALDRSRETAKQAAQSVESNPLGVLVGGLAVGMLAAALLPRSQKEKDTLAPLGKRVSAAAVAAVAAARDAGRQELASAGISKHDAKDKAQDLFGTLKSAAGNAASAAAKAAADRGKEKLAG